MVNILTWFILSYGLMNIMVYGSIFQGMRDFFQRWGGNKDHDRSRTGPQPTLSSNRMLAQRTQRKGPAIGRKLAEVASGTVRGRP